MRDNWCVGYTNKFTVGVWVGNVSGAPMRDVSGITGAAPVWLDVMNYLHGRYASVRLRRRAV
jgi:penicillin-binding protein 1C